VAILLLQGVIVQFRREMTLTATDVLPTNTLKEYLRDRRDPELRKALTFMYSVPLRRA
jgi:hypothetical protein